MTNLKEINFGLNQYCGPSVLSALTGKSTDECAAVISRVNGQQNITAVAMKDLMKAFELLRFNVTKEKVFGATLYAALVSLYKREGFYIVLIPRHVVAVEVSNDKIFLVDNHSKQPLDASQSARLLQKVLEVYKVTPKPEPKLIRISYEDERNGNIIHIWRHEIYENEADSMSAKTAAINFSSIEELKSIKRCLDKQIKALEEIQYEKRITP